MFACRGIGIATNARGDKLVVVVVAVVVVDAFAVVEFVVAVAVVVVGVAIRVFARGCDDEDDADDIDDDDGTLKLNELGAFLNCNATGEVDCMSTAPNA